MITQLNVQPMDEENYLKYFALFSLVIGTIFISGVLESFISQYFFNESVVTTSLNIIRVFLYISMVVIIFRMSAPANRVLKKTLYWGNFQDEYLNYISAKGYNYAFNFVFLYLVVAYLFIDLFGEFPESISLVQDLQGFCELSAGLMLICYALVVLYLLKGADDE